MPKITLYLKDAEIHSEVSGILTSGMAGVEVNLVCDDSWEGLKKTLVCRAGDIAKTVFVENDRAVVAHETMVAGKWLELGVEGISDDGSVVIPTLWERCCIVLPGVDSEADPTVDPTMPIWAQLQRRVSALEIPPVPSDIGALPGPLAAKVGQHFQVAAVNKIGMVTAVEAVDMPGGNYELSAATAETLGGVKAESATDGDTQPVRIGEDGMLYTAPGSGGGEVWETIVDYTVPEDCIQVFLKTDINGKQFKLKKAIAAMIIHPTEDVEKSQPIRYTVDGTVDNVYNAEDYAHGACGTPSAAGKCSYARIEVVKTPIGVWLRRHTAATDLSYNENGYSGGREASIYEGINLSTLHSGVTEISAIGVGSYLKCIGKGTRIVMVGVRE